MDLAGIGAVAAAAVAAVGIPAALLVGRWQLRSAMRATEETGRVGIAQAEASYRAAEEAGRVGIAQAEASYRAALDAVRATATEAHSQWLRGVRREAYSAFLFACSQAIDTAGRLVSDSHNKTIVVDQRDARLAVLEDAISKLEHSVLIVHLEGPEDLGQRAEPMAAVVIQATTYSRRIFELHEGWLELERMADGPNADPEVVDFYRACNYLSMISPDGVRAVPVAELEDRVRHAVEAMEESHNRLPLPVYTSLYAAKDFAMGDSVSHYRARADQMELFIQLRHAFIETVRQVLDTTS